MLSYLLGEKPTLRICSLTDCCDEFVCAYNSGDFRGRQQLPLSDKKKLTWYKHRHQNRWNTFISAPCSFLRDTWPYLRNCRRSVLPYTRFCNCLLDYDCVLHIVIFAILYISNAQTYSGNNFLKQNSMLMEKDILHKHKIGNRSKKSFEIFIYAVFNFELFLQFLIPHENPG
jgi:hypothetical protein